MQLLGFNVTGHEGKVLRLKKVLYGLCQAPRAWNVHLYEHAVYKHGHGGACLLIGIYVDDLKITRSNPMELKHFKDEMKAQFLMSEIGLLSFSRN